MFRKLVAKSAGKWLRSPRGKKRSPWRRHLPLSLETLESRILLSADNWIGGSGNWDVGSNWSLGSAPGATDTAIINTSSAATITIQSGDNIQIQGVTTAGNDTLAFTGGSLTVTSGTSTLSGAMSMSGGSVTATGAGVSLTADGSTTVAGASLDASGGAVLSLPKLTSYTGTTQSYYSSSMFAATGTGSKLDLGALSTVNLTTDGTTWDVNASQGGQIDLSQLATVSVTGGNQVGAQFTADGAGSQIDISSLTSLSSASTYSSLKVTNSGAILDGKLTTLNDVAVTLDGSGTLATNQWASITNFSSITVTGGSYSLSGITDFDGSSLSVSGGASLSLPNLTSYTGANYSYYSSTTFAAAGAGSKLSLGALSSVDLTTDGTTWDVNATQGGQIDLSQLATVSVTGTNQVGAQFTADGAGSQIDISSLTSLSSASTYSSLKVSNDGTILDGKLTTLDDVAVSLDGTGTLAISQWASVTNFSSITVTGGAYSLTGLTDFDGSSLSVSGGAVLSLPNLTSYTGANYSYYSSTTFAAAGAGSKLSLGALATVNLATNGTTWYVNATQGGQVDLSQLKTVSATATNAVAVQFTADSAANQIDLSSLTTLSGLNLQLSSGVPLNFPALTSGDVTLTNGTSVTIQGTVVSIPAVGTSGATINLPSSQDLTITVQNSGTLTNTTFNVGQGTSLALTSGTYDGNTSFSVAQGATVDLVDGASEALTVSGVLTGSGSGNVQLTGGVGGASDGLFIGTGGATFNFPGSMFQWNGQVIRFTQGDLTNQGTITLAGSGKDVLSSDGTLYNYGTIIQSGSGNLSLHSDNVSPTILNNEAGASYLLESDSGIDNAYGGQVAVQNAGTIKKTAGTGTSQLYINGALSNTGTVEADSGTLYLDANSISQIANNTLSTGTWNALNGATLQFPSATSIATNQANVSLDGSGASITGITALTSNSGSLNLSNGAALTTTGDLSNSGSLTLGAGSAAGSTLTVGGAFTQTAAGTLNVQLGGTPASGDFGQVAVTGTATLGGGLNVSLVNGFTPSGGQDFKVMTYASASGTFDTVTGLGSVLTESVNPTSLDLTSTGTRAAIDLDLTSVTAPAAASTGQPITVNWTVSNSSSNAATGSWMDSVFLSTTPTITGSSVLLGSATHTGGLAANASYNASLIAPIPALTPGNYYVLVQTDSHYQEPDSNRGNNVMAATTGQLAVSVPGLALGTPANGTFTAADQDQYYQVTVPASGSLQVSLTSAASSGALALYVSRGTQPTPYNFQESATLAGQPNQSLNVPVTGAGTYYILVHSVSGAAATVGYTLNVTQTSALTVSAPSRAYTGGNGGNLTLDIKGTNFSSNTTATLSLGNTTINAASIYFHSASEIYATYNLNGVATGNYTLTVQNGSEQATSPAPVAVVPATMGNPVQLALATPSLVSAGRDGILTVTVTNTSNNDVLAPLLFLTTDGATLKLPSQMGFQGATLNFLATSPTGPAGILTPGKSVQIQIQFQSTTTNPTINFQLYQAEDNQPMDWASAESSLQGNIPTGAWNVIWSNFLANIGGTVGSYHTVLANDATYLGQLGEYGNDVNALLDFELDKAADDFITPTLTTVTDVSFPAPGLPLTFVRTFQQPIDRRSTPGPLGLGWTDNWQLSLSTDAQGNVTIKDNGQGRYFALQSDGSYRPGPGDFATLTLANGIYTLHETDGSLLVFTADGTLNYLQDADGNRITCGYTNGQLTSLTSSDGQKITIAYNTQGLISQVTAPDGQITTYTYDSNQHLVSYTDQYGTTNYTYLSGQSNPATINALSEIAYADNTHLYFSYDSQGRLIDQHRDNGQEEVSYSYLPVNGYVMTDGDGNKTTYLIDNAGNVCEVIDPLDNATKYTYDDNGNLTQLAAPLGVTYTYSYDAKGNLTNETDALGHTVAFTYDANNNLTSYTDAKGNTTAYSYDSSNNLLSITYANGTKEQYSYNPLGEATQFLNARGQAIGCTYNTQGEVLTETFADGTSFTYTYDSHGNLTSAKDAQGNVTTFVYGDTNNPNLLTEVDYPDSTFLKFTYNIAGQRTQSVDQTGFTVNYSYDALGRLSKLTDGNNNLIVEYAYDAGGNLIQKDMGNGTRTVYTYDAAGDVLSITNLAPDHTTVNSFDKYTCNALGNVLTDTNQDGQWVYTYDANSQLVQAVFTPNSSDQDGLTAQNLQYDYDAAGNRISETVNGVTTTYAVNNVNEYTSTTTNGATTAYQYDADGNLIAQTTGSNTTNYTFNELSQLTAVNGPNLSASYSYDPLGNRVSQTANGVATKIQIDPGTDSVATEFDNSGNLIAHYTYGTGLVSQVDASGSTGYYDFDLTGNTVGITGAAGTYVNRYVYLPFGQTTTVAAAVSNPFTFVGQFGVSSNGSGLVDMRARSYDPSTGQFVSNDPLGLSGGDTNTRGYVANSPINRVDPSGLQGCQVQPADPERDQGGAARDALAEAQQRLDEWNRAHPQGSSAQPTNSLVIPPGLLPLINQCLSVPTTQAPTQVVDPGGIPANQNPGLYGSPDSLQNADPTETVVDTGEDGDPPNTGGPGGGPGCQHNNPPPTPPSPPRDPGPGGHTPNHIPHDPNALIGPAGYGTQGFIQPNGTWSYMAQFENDGTASALDVTVTEQLDPNLDWSTFQLGSFGFGSVNVAVPAGLTQYQTSIAYQNADGSPLNVKVNLNFNVQTGLLTVTFISIDPATGQAPTGALDGFLPPDDSAHIGEGYVQYTIQPKANLASGTAINGQASVVFDTNAAIQTQTVTNTIDATTPTSSVNPLPAKVNSPSFTVSWSGSDPNGPGIASYTVYVSDNGGAFTPWLTNTTQTSATYNGQVGHHYSFYSVASDALGLTQPTPSGAQATTYVFVPTPPPPPPPPPHHPPAPPTLQVPPLLAFFDSLLGGVETINGNGTETITDSIFGIPLIVANFDGSGKLTDVTLLRINLTLLFELL